MTWETAGVLTLIGGLVTSLVATWRIMLVDRTHDRDFWRDMALGLLVNTEKAVSVAEHVVKHEPA